MRALRILLAVCGVLVPYIALADNAQALAALRSACAADAQQLCAGVQPGGGRIVQCLSQHKEALSAGCKQAIAQAGPQAGASSSGAAPANPDGASASTTVNPGASTGAVPASPNVSPAAKPSHSSPTSTAKGGAPGAYLLMKQVDVIDPGAQNIQAAQPAYHLLVPATWTFKGTIIFGGSKGGCFADLFGLSMEGKSADGSIVFQGAPDYSWQYADDPAILHKLNDPNRRALGTNGKPCPISKPVTAEAYFRQNVAPLYPSGSTVVSVEAFPELDAIARRRLGLPPGIARTAAAQTDAIRARIEYPRDGKPVEEWVALAVITRIYPAGRGKFYDCHATDLRAMRAPKGKLDANDKLFKAMISSVQPVPKWQNYSNGILAKFYQAEAQKEAAQDQIVANLQAQVAATINGVTANMMQGSNNSAFAADQNIRGVQTFRDPTTGGTFELSNQYDHAWLNGANEYVMSDDANFNPNGQVSGNWSQLQAVRPSP